MTPECRLAGQATLGRTGHAGPVPRLEGTAASPRRFGSLAVSMRSLLLDRRGCLFDSFELTQQLPHFRGSGTARTPSETSASARSLAPSLQASRRGFGNRRTVANSQSALPTTGIRVASNGNGALATQLLVVGQETARPVS
jgi:hypothetical protein